MSQSWLILHAGALGDLVLTIQLALDLDIADACGRLDVLSRADPGDLSTYRPLISRRSLDGIGSHQLYANDEMPLTGPVSTALRGRRVLNALGDCNSLAHRRIVRVAAETLSLDPRARPGLSEHITAQWQHDLLAQGYIRNTSSPLCECLHPAQNHAPADAVLIHPGSGGVKKCWALENFIAVAHQLRRAGRNVEFLIGPVERERWPHGSLDALVGEFAFECIEDSSRLVARLSRAALLIGNDSGTAHLASLLGVPTLTLFGPTDARIWHPRGPWAYALQGDASLDSQTWGIPIARVAAAAVAALSRNRIA